MFHVIKTIFTMLLIFVSLLATSLAYPTPLYSNYTLVRTVLTTTQLEQLEKEFEGIDVWESMWTSEKKEALEVDALLCPKGLSALTKMELEYDILMELGDVQRDIDEEQERMTTQRIIMEPGHYDPGVYFQDFRRLQEIYEFCDTYLTPTYSNVITPYILGPTVQGRSIQGYRISTNSTISRPGIYIDAQVHAREWLATPTLLYIVNSLLEDLANGDSEIVELLSELEIHFTPIVNLDGFEYTWNTDRLWRKNRRPNGGGVFGVDLNRNWGPSTTWCTSGSSTNPSSGTYCGTAPFSEPEIEATRRYIDDLGIFRAGIDFHTTGPLILWPWQYTRNRVPEPNYSRLKNLGDQMARSMNAVYGFGYRSIQGVDLYPHAGGFIDYNFQINDMVTYTVEGRGPGFVIAPSQIVPSGIENYEGFKEMLRHVLEEL